MGSVADNEGTKFIGKVNVLVGAENTTPTNLVGLIEEPGPEIVPTKSSAQLRTTSKQGATAIDDISAECAINFILNQHEIDTWALALGETESGQVVEIGGAPSVGRKYALRLTGLDGDGAALQFDAPSCAVAPSGAWNFHTTEHGAIPVNLVAQDHVDNTFMARWTKGGGSQDVTLSSDTFTRVIGTPETYHRIAGESAAADDVLKITAGDLVDGEILTCQIFSTAQPLTFKHTAAGADDNLDLAAAEGADITLRALTDFIRLTYLTDEWLYLSHRATA